MGLEVEEAHHLDQDQFPDQFHDRGRGPLTIPEDLKIVIEIKIDLIIEMSMVFVIADTSSQANKAKVEVAEASTHSIMEVQVISNFNFEKNSSNENWNQAKLNKTFAN